MNSNKLSPDFYLRNDVVLIAQELLGKKLCTNINGIFTSGIIVETEAYSAPEDPASHAYKGKLTPRTMPFFEKGGIAYVYLIYGVYKLFNVITNEQNHPHAVLIRAIQPVDGIEFMLKRRNLTQITRNITSGPGLTSIALGIELNHNLVSLWSDEIWIENAASIPQENIDASPRIGMGKNVFEPYYSMPWRFRIKENYFLDSPI
ncbi:MAG: DNA-3-methyladenine glycosylase [Flavobacteriaceae bacterium]|nr:DNA-3-methyladenine glycosylase [Flavobacteriaceae bacterium]